MSNSGSEITELRKAFDLIIAALYTSPATLQIQPLSAGERLAFCVDKMQQLVEVLTDITLPQADYFSLLVAQHKFISEHHGEYSHELFLDFLQTQTQSQRNLIKDALAVIGRVEDEHAWYVYKSRDDMLRVSTSRALLLHQRIMRDRMMIEGLDCARGKYEEAQDPAEKAAIRAELISRLNELEETDVAAVSIDHYASAEHGSRLRACLTPPTAAERLSGLVICPSAFTDEIGHGYYRGQVGMIGAGTNAGKSWMLIHEALAMAATSGQKGMLISSEVSVHDQQNRFASVWPYADPGRYFAIKKAEAAYLEAIRTYKESRVETDHPEPLDYIASAADPAAAADFDGIARQLCELKLSTVYLGNRCNLETVEQLLREEHAARGLDFVCIENFQDYEIKRKEKRQEAAYEELRRIAKRLTVLAEELNIFILFACHLSADGVKGAVTSEDGMMYGAAGTRQVAQVLGYYWVYQSACKISELHSLNITTVDKYGHKQDVRVGGHGTVAGIYTLVKARRVSSRGVKIPVLVAEPHLRVTEEMVADYRSPAATDPGLDPRVVELVSAENQLHIIEPLNGTKLLELYCMRPTLPIEISRLEYARATVHVIKKAAASGHLEYRQLLRDINDAARAQANEELKAEHDYDKDMGDKRMSAAASARFLRSRIEEATEKALLEAVDDCMDDVFGPRPKLSEFYWHGSGKNRKKNSMSRHAAGTALSMPMPD